jgi:hypothetical protein
LPPFTASDATLPAQALGRVLIDIWTEATRDEVLRARLRTVYESHLDQSLQAAAGSDTALSTILRIGTLIQLLTRGDGLDAAAVARRLGIEQAA